MKRWIEQAKKIISLQSTTPEGNEDLVNYLSGVMAQIGLQVEVQPVFHANDKISKRQLNLIGVHGDPLVDRKTRKGLLLLTHLDTLNAGNRECWSELDGEPLVAQEKDGRLYGLGAADAKLDFLCKLHAVARFRERELPEPIYLVGSCGENAGMLGARYLIESYAVNPRVVLVGKPTGLALGVGHKRGHLVRVSVGYGVVERGARGFNRRVSLSSKGRVGHSAFPDEGVNAISQLLAFLQDLANRGFEFKFTRLAGGEFHNRTPDRAEVELHLNSHQLEDFKRCVLQQNPNPFEMSVTNVGDTGIRFVPDDLFACIQNVIGAFTKVAEQLKPNQDTRFDPPHSTFELTQMNQWGPRTDLYFDVRVPPHEAFDFQEIERGIQETVQKYPAFNISMDKVFTTPGVDCAESEWIETCLETMKEVDIRPERASFSFASEAGLYLSKDYPTVTFGPGVARGNVHSPNESIDLAQAQKAISFYEKVIEKALT